jgi:PAS domain S-box-containing protein
MDYHGLTLQEAQREDWSKGLHPDDVEPALKVWQEAMLHRKPYEAEVRLRGVDGRYHRFLSRGVPLYDDRGQLVQWFGTNTEIEDRKQAEEALLEAQAELAHLTRVMTLGEVAASIAHEVNQPLAAVVTNGNACLRWLAREVPDLDEARASVERIIRDGHRASDVIRRIRALAKHTDPQKTWLDLCDVIHEVIAPVHSEVHKHSVSLLTELSAALPPVLGDRIQLQQVLLNLMMNGIEAMHPVMDRPRELRIKSQRSASDTMLVAVRDSGIGLNSQSMGRLFDAFFTTKPEGMGLGLSVSRRIIDAHGGRLWATPNEDHGMSLLFILPIGNTSVL